MTAKNKFKALLNRKYEKTSKRPAIIPRNSKIFLNDANFQGLDNL